jgi:hypothetical protein
MQVERQIERAGEDISWIALSASAATFTRFAVFL